MSWRDFLRANNAALVWRFEHAPEELQALSVSGGDEDYITAYWLDHWIPQDGPPYLYEQISNLSCCGNDEFDFEGFKVIIGSHA